MNTLRLLNANSLRKESKLCSFGTGYSGRKYSFVSMDTLQRFAISFVLVTTSLILSNSSYISSGDLKYCSDENTFFLFGSLRVLPVLIQTLVS